VSRDVGLHRPLLSERTRHWNDTVLLQTHSTVSLQTALCREMTDSSLERHCAITHTDTGVEKMVFKVLVFMVLKKNKKSRKVGFFGFMVFLDIVVFLYKLCA